MAEIEIRGDEPDDNGENSDGGRWEGRTENHEMSDYIDEEMVKDDTGFSDSNGGWTGDEEYSGTAGAEAIAGEDEIPLEKVSNVHMSSGESDDVIPFEESAQVGVMHGDQIDRTEIEEMQREIDRLKAELEVAQTAIESAALQSKENFELAQRKQAEFVNFRNRMRQENETNRKRAVESLVEDLLPVLDSLQKAVYSIPPADADSPWADGLLRTFHLFVNSLARYNVTVISQSGVPFNPEHHSAMLVVDDDDHPDNTIIEVYQNGYLVADRLLRPAMVKVGRNTKAYVPKTGQEKPLIEIIEDVGGEQEAAAAKQPDSPAREKPEGETSGDGLDEMIYELGDTDNPDDAADSESKRIKSLEDIIED